MPTARRGGVFTARCSFSLLYCALQKPYDGLAVVFFHLPVVLVVHVLSARERRRSCPHCQECLPLLLRKVFLRCPFQKDVRPELLSVCCGCVPSLLCGHCFAHVSPLLITSCRYPCERCQTCDGTPSSGCDRLFLELQKHILKAGGGHAHLLKIPPLPPYFFSCLKNGIHATAYLLLFEYLTTFMYSQVSNGAFYSAALGRFLCYTCGNRALLHCTAVLQPGGEHAPSCVRSNLPKVSKNKKKCGEMTTLFMPVLSVQCWVCECCGLYRSKCLDLFHCPHHLFCALPTPLFVFFIVCFPPFLSCREERRFSSLCFTWHCDLVQLA